MKKKVIIFAIIILLLAAGIIFWWWQGQPRLRQLTFELGGDWTPRFSPDGEKIVFISDRTGNDEIWIMNYDGTNQRQLTFNEEKRDNFPSFSPDGQEIVFSSVEIGSLNLNWDIWIMNRDGTNQRQLTFDKDIDAFPFFSPDGKEIVFTSERGDVKDDILVFSHIWIMNRDGTNQRQLTFNKRFDANPSFGPSGKEIIFDSIREDDGNIWLLKLK